MTFTLSSFAFSPDPAALPVGGPPWNSDAGNGTSLTFAGCVSGVLGSPGCLVSREGILVSTVTSSTTLPVNTYLQFELHPNLIYSLVSVGPGSANTNCAAASVVGTSCSIFAGSPIVLTKSSTGTTISFVVAGRTSDTGAAGLAAGSTYSAVFSAMVAGKTPGDIQLFFCPGVTCTASDFTSGKSLTVSQSGDFVATAPP